MFYDNFKDACGRKGTNISTVLSELGRATGNTGTWKLGKFPRLDIVIEIAEYLHISLDELVYGLNQAPYSGNKAQGNEIDGEWVDIITHIPADRQQMCKDFLRTHMVVIPDKYVGGKEA